MPGHIEAISPQFSLSIAACRLCLQIYDGWLMWIKIILENAQMDPALRRGFYCYLMISAILVNLWYSQSVVVWIFNLSWPKPYFWIFKFACNFRISLSSGPKKLLLSLTWLMIIIWLTFEILNRGSYRVIQDEGFGFQLSSKRTYSNSDMQDGDA